MRKSFFNEDNTVTTEGGKLLTNMDNYFNKMYDDYMELGYNPRELSLMIMDCMTLIQAKKNSKVLDIVAKEKKEKISLEHQKKIKSTKQTS